MSAAPPDSDASPPPAGTPSGDDAPPVPVDADPPDPSLAPEDTATCRICLDDAPLSLLVSPCACRGSMKHVHRACLDRWRLRSRKASSFSKCDYCGTPYRVRKTWWAPFARAWACRAAVSLLIIALAVMGLGYAARLAVWCASAAGWLPSWWGAGLVAELLPALGLVDSEEDYADGDRHGGDRNAVAGTGTEYDVLTPPASAADLLSPWSSLLLGACAFAACGIWLLVSDLARAVGAREPPPRARPAGDPAGGGVPGAGFPQDNIPGDPAPAAGAGGGWLGGLAVTGSAGMTVFVLLIVGAIRAGLVVWEAVRERCERMLLGLDVDYLE
ncbi:hypothetical protein DFJ74DRAFT_676522 [Hyaloraphidium curvatum]|nr:hypothetical protein DFJ74DRAFT_676522 [Hyaloraphidium curvatum]